MQVELLVLAEVVLVQDIIHQLLQLLEQMVLAVEAEAVLIMVVLEMKVVEMVEMVSLL